MSAATPARAARTTGTTGTTGKTRPARPVRLAGRGRFAGRWGFAVAAVTSPVWLAAAATLGAIATDARAERPAAAGARSGSLGPAPGMATVGPGAYEPLFPPSPSETSIPVRAFLLDRVPVTNAEYLAFVRAEPSWRRDRIAPVLAEKGYLAHWQSEGALGAGVDPAQPVVSVSWFSARAYCAWRGARLPLEAEWELAAAASPTEKDAKRDPAWRAELVSLYSRPSPPRLPLVGAGQPNAWGVRDMHGLVWEWVEDFDAAVAAFSSGSDRLRFCGATAGPSSDATDFAAFERVAFRSSLRGAFTTKNLGFRCARDLPKEGASR